MLQPHQNVEDPGNSVGVKLKRNKKSTEDKISDWASLTWRVTNMTHPVLPQAK
jgi:hypothetical protein